MHVAYNLCIVSLSAMKLLFSSILVTLLVLTNIHPSVSWGQAKKYHIIVINGLNNTNPLLVHCASGDDDLGWHTLKHADEVKWDFRTNIFDTTLFFCHFWWGENDRAFEVFRDGENEDCKDSSEGGNKCYWLVKPQGFYMANYKANFPGSDWKKKHDWIE